MKNPEEFNIPFVSVDDAKQETPEVLQSRADFLRSGLAKEIGISAGSAFLALTAGLYMLNTDQIYSSVVAGTIALLGVFSAQTAGIFALRDREELNIVNIAMRTEKVDSNSQKPKPKNVFRRLRTR